MTTDRLFGNTRGPWTWVMCGIVLALAAVSAVEWVRWGGGVFLIGAVALGGLAVTGAVRLIQRRHQSVE